MGLGGGQRGGEVGGGQQKQRKGPSSQGGSWAADPREATCTPGTVGMGLGLRREGQRVEGESEQRHLELGAGPWLGYRRDRTCHTLLPCVMSGSVPGVFRALPYRGGRGGQWEANGLGLLSPPLHWASVLLTPSVLSTRRS